jgi:cytochrome c-type biogenesis protein CcmH/NrfG
MYSHLVAKYQTEIESDPRLHAEWQFKIARAHARAGDAQSARGALRHSVRLRPAKLSRWLVLMGSLGGNAATQAAFGAYVRFAAARQRAQR